LHVAQILAEVLATEPPALLTGTVAAGELGLKTGRGFSAYGKDGRAIKRRRFEPPDDDLVDRLILPLINEAVACLHENIVEDGDLLDAGVIFGTGFAPFTGGPLHYARERGVAVVVQKLESLAKRFGTRFTPHEGWQQLRDQA
jgi:3-hydroxyacyl-CoA dehydrogenase/enoyl-CoA hydratase/3-hydroxybutyryl-CoA epimerase